jgi:hypothetical protein
VTEAGQKRVRWGDVPGWLQVLLAFVALLAIFGVFHVATSSPGSPRPPSPSPSTGHKGSTTTAVYLSDLQPTDGDIPKRGDTQSDNQDFQHSIFYEGVSSTQQSNASACQNAKIPTCRATDYSIASGEYHHFSAMLGVEIEGGSHVAQWSLSIDGVVVKSSTVTVNSSPQQITVAISPGHDLELQVSTPDLAGIAYRDAKIVWGDAQLS